MKDMYLLSRDSNPNPITYSSYFRLFNNRRVITYSTYAVISKVIEGHQKKSSSMASEENRTLLSTQKSFVNLPRLKA